MRVVGLCGGSGSGKGVVSAFFKKLGFAHIDADAVYRELTSCPSECLDALATEFGSNILASDGSLDRRKLAKVVFFGACSAKYRERLNEISHKFVLAEIRNRIERFSSLSFIGAIVDAPLLFESGFDAECDAVVCVTAPKEMRIERIISRDGLSREEAIGRIDSQISDDQLRELSDYEIVNCGSLDELEKEVVHVAEDILNYER